MLLLTVELRRAVTHRLPGVTRMSVCRRSWWLLVTVQRSPMASRSPGVPLTLEPWNAPPGRPSGANWSKVSRI